ncbi:MAG: globin domain-containing protein [Myxococcota bacterium]
MPLDLTLLSESFEKAIQEEGRLMGRFYELLFERYPGAKALFGRNAPEKQQKMLQETLVAAIEHLEDAKWIEETLGSIGALHVDYGVEEQMYPWVGECLIAALSETLGDDWTAAHEAAWAEVYGTLTTYALAGAKR